MNDAQSRNPKSRKDATGADEAVDTGRDAGVIREATLEDLSPLSELYVAYRVFYAEPPLQEAAERFLRSRLERGAAKYFLAWTASDAAPAAFLHLMPSTNTLAMRPIWLLEDLYVDPAARGQGVATALLRHAEEFARGTGAERITLATADDNAMAQSVYRKLGYVREERFLYFHRVLA